VSAVRSLNTGFHPKNQFQIRSTIGWNESRMSGRFRKTSATLSSLVRSRLARPRSDEIETHGLARLLSFNLIRNPNISGPGHKANQYHRIHFVHDLIHHRRVLVLEQGGVVGQHCALEKVNRLQAKKCSPIQNGNKSRQKCIMRRSAKDAKRELTEVLPRFELGSLDSKSRVLTITP
jgi:hypothetical protein